MAYVPLDGDSHTISCVESDATREVPRSTERDRSVGTYFMR
jgi:hypothetical protein